MKKIILSALTIALLLGLFIPATAVAKTQWDLEGWRISQGKWMDGLLWTWYEGDWVPYRLNSDKYNGADISIGIQHDYMDGKGNYGIDAARNFFVGPQTNRNAVPEGIVATYNAGQVYPGVGQVFHVEGPTVVPISNGSILNFQIVVDNPDALTALGDFAFYWEAHCSVSGSPGIVHGSSYFSGASLHAHTSVTGNQDVPIKTPPQYNDLNPSILLDKKFGGPDCGWWDVLPDGYVMWTTYTVGYKYIITNTGDATLSNITLFDDKLGDLSYLLPATSLAAGASMEVITPQMSFGVGENTNVGTVTGYYGGIPYSDEDMVTFTGIYWPGP